MSPTDLPPSRGAEVVDAPGPPPGSAERLADCPIIEESIGPGYRFTIPPTAGVVPVSQLLFALAWASVWTLAILLYVMLPNERGPVFEFFALLVGVGGEYLALFVLFSALVARFAVETISVGPEGVARQICFGPLRHTTRVSLARAKAFTIHAIPLSHSTPAGRGWTAHLTLQKTPDPAPRGTEGSGSVPRPLRLAEGGRDEDKFWLAHRLNQRLRANQSGGEDQS